jgi:hypothetical protein
VSQVVNKRVIGDLRVAAIREVWPMRAMSLQCSEPIRNEWFENVDDVRRLRSQARCL